VVSADPPLAATGYGFLVAEQILQLGSFLVINDYSPEQLTAFGALATTGTAIVAAFFGGWAAWEAYCTRNATTQPFVVVSIEQSPVERTVLNLVIENIGQTMATNVRFGFDPPLASKHFDSHPAADLSQSRLITDGIPSLPPGYRIERVFEVAKDRDPHADDGYPWAFNVEVHFNDHRRRKPRSITYVLDFRPLADGTRLETYSTHHVAASLRNELPKLTRSVQQVATELEALTGHLVNTAAEPSTNLTGRRD